MVIAMSPINESFVDRLRRFPSFVNCTTIDWFSEWPEEALFGVGKDQLFNDAEDLKIADKLDDIVGMFQFIHKSVEKYTIDYREKLGRHNYVTPTSYLELLKIF